MFCVISNSLFKSTNVGSRKLQEGIIHFTLKHFFRLQIHRIIELLQFSNLSLSSFFVSCNKNTTKNWYFSRFDEWNNVQLFQIFWTKYFYRSNCLASRNMADSILNSTLISGTAEWLEISLIPTLIQFLLRAHP